MPPHSAHHVPERNGSNPLPARHGESIIAECVEIIALWLLQREGCEEAGAVRRACQMGLLEQYNWLKEALSHGKALGPLNRLIFKMGLHHYNLVCPPIFEKVEVILAAAGFPARKAFLL